MEQAVITLSNTALKKGFRLENGLVVKWKIDDEGNLIRKRKNWKSEERSFSRQYILDRCEECGSVNNLTIHHKKPLSTGGSKHRENCVTLCGECHKLIHQHKRRSKQEERILFLEKGLWGEYRISS